MTAPILHPHPSGGARVPYPVRLILGVGMAAVGLLFCLIAWRLVHIAQPKQPAANKPRASVRSAVSAFPQSVVEIAAPPREREAVPPVAKLVPEDAEKQLNAEKAPANVSPRLPEAMTADLIVEQRLRVSEDDLRSELRGVPELCLLSDDEVKKIRSLERAAQAGAVKEIRAAKKDALAAIRNEQRAMRHVRGGNVMAAQEMIALKANTNAKVIAVQERIAQLYNLRLQQTMRQAAVQSGLSLRSGPSCRLAPSTAAVLGEMSKTLRDMGFVTVPGAPSQGLLREPDRTESYPGGKTKAFQTWCDGQKVEQFSGTVPTLMQMLQIEDEPTRLLLVRELARVKSNSAAAELAGRAIMDLSPKVRRAALAALQRRSWYQYTPVLLRGLSYPWPPVADRAAVALRTLAPQDAAGKLVDLLDRPAPSAPVWDAQTNQYRVRELVRLNHLRNCLLCHASSENKEDGLVRGVVPTPGTPLPKAGPKGGGYYAGSQGDFVRADTTFLHQDFSVVLPDESVAPWPSQQRFDFVTRMRTVSADEIASLSASSGKYPQREAVLYALRGITGKDGGDSSAKWRELLGIAQETKR